MDEIIKRALIDESAMSQLLEELEPFVFRLSYHLTRHQQDAEDIAQDVLYKICTKLNMFRGDSSLQTWVYSLVINTHRDFLRKKKLRTHDELPETLSAGGGSFEDEADTRIILNRLLQDLPEVDRHILVLRFQNDLTVREVAEIMNISESNVKTRVFRLKDRLRGLFYKGGEVL
ncbi:MAG: sigma-70 family RNA polymerase sigma factor [Tumebacillaceae bacterium]